MLPLKRFLFIRHLLFLTFFIAFLFLYPQTANAAAWDKNTIDSTGDVGQYTSLQVGSDGFARISYYDSTNSDLKFVQCTNTSCSTNNITTVDSTGTVGEFTSLKMGSDGYARISYYDIGNKDLKFVQCTNATCSTKNITTIDSTGDVGRYSSLALGSDGFARIGYTDYTNADLKFVQCTNASCTTNSITTVDSTGNVGYYLSLALGSDGFARISYSDGINGDLKFVQCTNATCSTSNIATIDSGGNVGDFTSLALGSDGYARISYYDGSQFHLKLAQCTNASCTTNSITTVDSTAGKDVGRYSSIAMASDGYARISYVNSTDTTLKFAQCTNADCSTNTLTTIDSGIAVSDYTSLGLLSDYGQISYYDSSNQDLKIAIENESGRPTVSSFSPADGATGAALDSNLVITFNEAVDVKTGNITIKKTSDNSTFETINVAGSQVTGTGTSTITINPTAKFSGLTGYYVQIDSTAFDDTSGNGYAGISDTTTWNFTTTTDNTNPTVSTLSPTDNATAVATNSNLVITFDEPVDVKTGNITIKKTSDNSTIETIDVTSGKVTGTGTTTITVNPASTLSEQTSYYVQIDSTAFDDTSGNGYAGISDTTTWNFTTADETAPTITNVSSDKANGSYTTGEVIDIDVTFSEAVTSTGNVTVTLETGTTDRTCTFAVSSATTGTCNYTVQAGDNSSDLTVSAISGTIKDSSNNSMTNFVPATNLAANKSIVIDTAGPSVSSISSGSPTSSTATITWTTDEISSSKLLYGLTSGYGSNTSETDTSPRVTSHSVSLSSLLSCTTYYYEVVSVDSASNSTTSSGNTFTTAGCTASVVPTSSASNSITSSSGGSNSLTVSSKTFTVTAPADATNDATSFVIQIKALGSTDVLSSLGRPSPSPKEVGSTVFDVKAIINSNTVLDTFDKAITISYAYTDAEIAGINESTLKLYHYTGGAWVALNSCNVNTSANTISCTTPSFSIFGLFGEALASSASSGGTSSSTSSGSSTSSSSVCTTQAPDSAPDLFQISTSPTTATLYFAPANPATGYIINYGPSSSADQYAASFDNTNGGGSVSYIISHLAKGTTYYFRVQAKNGCKTGLWSRTLSQTTTSTESFGESTQITTTEPQGKIVVTDKKTTSKLEPSLTPAEDRVPESQKEGYDVKVYVNKDGKPVGGVTVELHSTPRRAKTDKDGIARFENVEGGEHTVLMAYNGYSGEEKITLNGDNKSVNVNLTVKLEPYNRWLIWGGGALFAILIGIIGFLLFTLKGEKSRMMLRGN